MLFFGPIYTGSNTRDTTRNATKWSQIPIVHIRCCLACSVYSPVATTGFVRPNLLRFSCRVQCGWGLPSGSNQISGCISIKMYSSRLLFSLPPQQRTLLGSKPGEHLSAVSPVQTSSLLKQRLADWKVRLLAQIHLHLIDHTPAEQCALSANCNKWRHTSVMCQWSYPESTSNSPWCCTGSQIFS